MAGQVDAATANFVIRLTPPGAAAIAVVRIAGPAVREFLRRHFSTPAKPGRCTHGKLCDGERVIDDPVVVLHNSGAAADISLHGGTWVVQACIDLARRAGFQLIDEVAPPVDPVGVDADSRIESEMLAHLPLAATELSLRTLLAQPEAWAQLNQRADTSSSEVETVLSDRALFWLLHPPRVAIVGAPNVGKSTLANRLFARERSITADAPGTTRDWVGEIANVDGLPVMLQDTPGQRETDDPIEHEAIERSKSQIASADLVIVVLDAGQALDTEQLEVLANYPGAMLAANKMDHAAQWDVHAHRACETVATTGAGVDELRRRISAHFGCQIVDIAQPRWWTVRQREILERAVASPQALREI